MPTQEDGRFTYTIPGQEPKKYFSCHAVAYKKFGREVLEMVSSSKTEFGALTISHLCGHLTCCNIHHLYLDPKPINDERAHCHFVMKRLYAAHGRQGLQSHFYDLDLCPHAPMCGSRYIIHPPFYG